MKFLILIFAALVISPTADAAGEKNPKKEAREKLKAAKEEYREGIKAFLDPKDKNSDGSLSEDEFIADEGDQEAASKRFNEANKNGDRSLTKSEIAEMLGLDKKLDSVKDAVKEAKKKKKK